MDARTSLDTNNFPSVTTASFPDARGAWRMNHASQQRPSTNSSAATSLASNTNASTDATLTSRWWRPRGLAGDPYVIDKRKEASIQYLSITEGAELHD